MKIKLCLLILSAVAAASFCQKNVLTLRCPVAGIFIGQEGRIAVCERDSAGGFVSFLSKKMEKETELAIKDSVQFPDNEGFGGYIAYLAVGIEDTVTHFQSIKLKFMSAASGKVIEAKYPVKTTYVGKWLDKGRVYCMGGKICRLDKDEIKVDRVSSVTSAEVSPDLKFCMNPVIQRAGAENIKVNIELENLTNQDMLNVDAYSVKDDGLRIVAFSDDPRYVYYRAGNMPTIYDVKAMQGVAVPDVTYKKPEYFGYYLKAEKSLYLYDFFNIAVFNKKSGAVDEVFANPFGTEFFEILDAAPKFIYGALYQKNGAVRDYTKLFALELKRNDFKIIPLPGRVQRAFVRDREGWYLYQDNMTLVCNEFKFK